MTARPNAASPKQPLTQILSPTLASDRKSFSLRGQNPITVSVSDKGPRVVSPPTKGKLYSWQARASPCESPCSHKSSTEGIVSASVIPSGSAPIAARSLTADATALYPTSSGNTPSVKWVSSTELSVETINSELGGTVSAAASSPTERSTNFPEPREEK